MKGKEKFRNRSVLQYKALSQPGLRCEFLIGGISSKWAVLWIKPHANKKVVSSIFGLSKIQGIIPDTIYLEVPLIAPVVNATLY